jgi:hypothetical protein
MFKRVEFVVNSKQFDRLGQGLCMAFCVAAAGMLYANIQTTELDATVTRTGLIVGHDLMSERAVQTDRGIFSVGHNDPADFKEGQRYHMTLNKTFTDPFMLGASGTIVKASPAP